MHNCNAFSLKKTQYGLSLLELMIALALGLVVLLGVSQSMIDMSWSSRAQLEKNNMGQTADIAFSYLAQQMRSALGSPCESIKTINANRKLTVHSLVGKKGGTIDSQMSADIANIIRNHGIGIVDQTDAKAHVTINGQTKTTDQIISFSTGTPVQISGETGIENPRVTIAGTDIFNQYAETTATATTLKEILFAVTDCKNMDIFRAESIQQASGNTVITAARPPKQKGQKQQNANFNVNYRAVDTALLAPVAISTYRIESPKSGDKNQASGGRLYGQLLYNQNSSNNLLDSVEMMRVLFGVDAAGDDGVVDTYITASQLSALPSNNTLVTMEIYLLISADGQRSNPAVSSKIEVKMPDTTKPIPQSGEIPMETLTFSDHVLRQVFTRTITLRNNAGL